MFGFQGGETADTVARKRGYMKEAQALWPFITNFDASTIKSEPQLIRLVKDRSGHSNTQAEAEVRAWAAERQF